MKADEILAAYKRGDRDFKVAKLRGVDLRGVDLGKATLQGATLQGAALWNASLRGADLQGADLRGTDLRGADLRGADLRGADLRGADLRGGNLAFAVGNRKEVHSSHFGEYDLVWTAENLWIGCEGASIIEWRNRSAEQVECLESGGGELWKKRKNFVLELISMFPARPTGE